MKTDGKNEIPGFSADYRGAYPRGPKAEKPAPQRRKPKKTARPRQERKAPRAAAEKKKRPAPPPDRRTRPKEPENAFPQEPEEAAGEEELLARWSAESAEDGPAALLREQKSRPRRRGKYRYGIFAGTLVLLLALVGVAFIAGQIGTRIHGALTDDSRLREYDQFLRVVVAQDPKPFASPQKADPEFVLNASLWKTMTENASSYTSYDDAGRTIVPLGDVAQACRELFGPDCRLQPKNPAQETFYEYDAAKSRFYVSLFSLDSVYAPYTQSARREDGGTVLRVGYVPPTDETRTQSGASSAGTPTPSKVMEYVIKTDPSTQKDYVYAVRSPAAS